MTYESAHRPNREGWVYFLHAQGTNKVKIGRSIKPIERQNQLQRQSPHKLVLFRSFHSIDSIADEASLHEQFAEYRGIGEWFDIFDQLAKFVEDEEMGCVEILDYHYSHTYKQIFADTLLLFQSCGAKPTVTLRRAIGNFLCECYPLRMGFFYHINKEMIPSFLEEKSLDPTSFIAGYLVATSYLSQCAEGKES